jgi:hypothetical protein
MVQLIAKSLRGLFHPHHANKHRPRVIHGYAYFVYVIGLGLWYVGFHALNTALGGAVLGYASNITADQVVEQVNTSRAAVGLTPVKVDPMLTAAALAKAAYMLEKQFWAHTAPDGTEPWSFIRTAGYRYQVAGENLARDFDTTPAMHHAWLASKTHRENIMNPRYTDIGVAVVDGKLFGSETTLVVQMFGRPAATAAMPSLTEAAQTSIVLGDQNAHTTTATLHTPRPSWLPERVILGLSAWKVGELHAPPLLSPTHIFKAVVLALCVMVLFTLIYDMMLMGHVNAVRQVGKNAAHMLFFLTIVFLTIFFKAGLIDAGGLSTTQQNGSVPQIESAPTGK